MLKSRDNQEIACQQVLMEDSSVFSIQWSIFPTQITAALTPDYLLESYLSHIQRASLAIIRPHTSAGGIEFRLFASSISLISFLPPEVKNDSLVLRICGGYLVQPRQCHRGEVRFIVEPHPAGAKVCLELSDYCPLILGGSAPSAIRRWLYRFTQAAIHRLVTVRFLTRLYRDLAGAESRVRVVNVQVRDGRPI